MASACLLALLTVATGLSSGTALAASGDYGPSTGPTNAPGGFRQVIAVRTFSQAGGTLPATSGPASIQVVVPAGAFTQPVQVVLTSPDLTAVSAALPRLGYRCYRPLAGVGVGVFRSDGSVYPAAFRKFLTLRIRTAGFRSAGFRTSGERALRLDGPTRATVVPAVLETGVGTTIRIVSDPDFVLITPSCAAARVVPAVAPLRRAPHRLAAHPVRVGSPGLVPLAALVLLGAGSLLAALALRRRRERDSAEAAGDGLRGVAGTHASEL